MMTMMMAQGDPSAAFGAFGSIILFGGNFEPRGWAFCNGQSLEIARYSALYSLLGTTYGGNPVCCVSS